MKKAFFFLFIVISLVVIHNLIQSTYGLWQKRDLILSAKQELKKEQDEKMQYERALATAKKQSFVEEQARDKLLLVKPGEMVVLLPSPTGIPLTDQAHVKETKPVWQQWITLFFTH